MLRAALRCAGCDAMLSKLCDSMRCAVLDAMRCCLSCAIRCAALDAMRCAAVRMSTWNGDAVLRLGCLLAMRCNGAGWVG